MTTQSKVSSPMDVTPSRPFSWPLALAILILGIVLGILATNLSSRINKTGAANAPESLSRNVPARPNLLELEKRTYLAHQNALAAESARYSSLGLFYAAGHEAQTQRAMAAEAARYNSLGQFYAVGNESGERAIAAEMARHEGLGEFYGANTQHAFAAEVARYKGLGEFYGIEENPLAMYHQSEWFAEATESQPLTLAWPSRPTQFSIAENAVTRLNENALAIYHQSEWGYSSIKANVDNDKGLMEFSAAKNELVMPAADNALTEYYQSEGSRIPNGVLRAENALAAYSQSERERVPIVIGIPQLHDREYGLARFTLPGNGTRPLATAPNPIQLVVTDNGDA